MQTSSMPTTNHEEYNNRLTRKRKVIKSFQAKANNNRTVSEKIADQLTLSLGSMTFLILNAIWFFLWITINLELIPGIPAFDPFPFGLLTMVVSLEAIFLAIIVLISQNREAKVADIRGEIDLHINTIAEEEITKIMRLQVLLLKRQGIDLSNDEELQQMLRPTDKNKIETQLEKQLG